VPSLFGRLAKVIVTSPVANLFDDPELAKAGERDIGLIITDHRIEFEIEHNLTKHPNQCLIKITNLSEATRSAFKKSPLHISLEAGYKDDSSLIFRGDITYALSVLNDADWVTTIQCGDGDRIVQHARVNKSYSAGTSIGNILEDTFKSVGQQIPDEIKNSDIFKQTLKSGMAISGKHKDVVPALLKPHGYTWSIQDGQPLVLKDDDAVGEVYTISEAEGMIGSPEFGKPDRKGRAPIVTIRTLLHPKIRPGHPVTVSSRDLSGTFKVLKVKHRGDSLGSDWVTSVEIRPISIGKNSAAGTGFSKPTNG
jgi:hypothetical protein